MGAVVVIALVLSITLISRSFSEKPIKWVVPVTLLCGNCNHSTVISAEEYRRALEAWSKKYPGSAKPKMTFSCPECNEQKAYKAFKCEKCSNVFFQNSAGMNALPDTCPKCGYSSIRDGNKTK